MATLMGIVLIILGVCILAAPIVAGTVTVMIVGSLMAIAGLVECVHAFRTTALFSRVIWLLVGLATLLCGVLVMAHPILGLSFLTILLLIYFFTDGLVKITAAFYFAAYRGWFIINGFLSFLLAYLIGSNWPFSGGWAIGVLVGINFIFTGIMALAVGEERL
ncbi:MAG: DUF308 domain-containing protein [Candidatus Omnitrophota bacterium]